MNSIDFCSTASFYLLFMKNNLTNIIHLNSKSFNFLIANTSVAIERSNLFMYVWTYSQQYLSLNFFRIQNRLKTDALYFKGKIKWNLFGTQCNTLSRWTSQMQFSIDSIIYWVYWFPRKIRMQFHAVEFKLQFVVQHVITRINANETKEKLKLN